MWSKTSRLGAKTQITLESIGRTDEQNRENISTLLTYRTQDRDAAGRGMAAVADGVVGCGPFGGRAFVFIAARA